MTYADMRRKVAAAIFEQDQDESFSEATRVAEAHALELADAAIRAMDRTDVMEFLRSAVALLDGALDSLGEAARLEARRERGKPMRSITHMHRYEAAQKMVDRGWKILGVEEPAE